MMKFGTLVDLYEKLLNTKFEANLTSMSDYKFRPRAQNGDNWSYSSIKDSFDFSMDSDLYFQYPEFSFCGHFDISKLSRMPLGF